MGCVFSTPRVDPEPFDDGENANVSGTTEKGYSVSEEAGFPRIKIEEASNVPGAAEKGNSSSEKAGFLRIKKDEASTDAEVGAEVGLEAEAVAESDEYICGCAERGYSPRHGSTVWDGQERDCSPHHGIISCPPPAENPTAAFSPLASVRFLSNRVSPIFDDGQSRELTPPKTSRLKTTGNAAPCLSGMSRSTPEMEGDLQNVNRLAPQRSSPPPKFTHPEMMPASATTNNAKAYLPVKQLRENQRRKSADNGPFAEQQVPDIITPDPAFGDVVGEKAGVLFDTISEEECNLEPVLVEGERDSNLEEIVDLTVVNANNHNGNDRRIGSRCGDIELCDVGDENINICKEGDRVDSILAKSSEEGKMAEDVEEELTKKESLSIGAEIRWKRIFLRLLLSRLAESRGAEVAEEAEEGDRKEDEKNDRKGQEGEEERTEDEKKERKGEGEEVREHTEWQKVEPKSDDDEYKGEDEDRPAPLSGKRSSVGGKIVDEDDSFPHRWTAIGNATSDHGREIGMRDRTATNDGAGDGGRASLAQNLDSIIQEEVPSGGRGKVRMEDCDDLRALSEALVEQTISRAIGILSQQSFH